MKLRINKSKQNKIRNVFTSCLFILFYSISFFSPAQVNGQKLSFNKDIAPIIYKNCTSCHREGQSAPFSLITYHDVASKATMIASVVKKRYMPPWKADPEFRHYDNETCLKNEDIDKILSWVKKGAKEGSEKLESFKLPEKVEARKPDFVIKMRSKFPIEGNNKETFAWIKAPYEIDTSASILDVEKLEFVGGNKKLLHHVNYEVLGVPPSLDIYSGPEFLIEDKLEKQVNPFNFMNVNPSKSYFYGGWLPGMNSPVYAEDVGVKFPKRGVLLYQTMHYAASPVNDSDFSMLNIYYKASPIKRNVRLKTVGTATEESIIEPPLVIPADSVKSFTATSILNFDASLMYVTPHMHLLGKKFVAYAILPSGDSIPLIRINDWDFNWQLMYRFNPMIHLPSGTKFYVRATFDNTSNNPRNPYNPPQTCYSINGMKTTEEMLQLGLFMVSYKEGDEKTILKSDK